MDSKRKHELISVYRNGLLNDTLPFWIEHGVDREFGGIMTALDRDGTVVDTDKGVWQQGRFTWLLGELAKATGDAEYAAKAKRCFHRFIDHNLNPLGVEPKFTSTRPMKGLGFPIITIVTAQELRESIGLPEANEWIDFGINDSTPNGIK